MEDTDESFVHLFFECEAVATIHDNFDRHLLQIQQEKMQVVRMPRFGNRKSIFKIISCYGTVFYLGGQTQNAYPLCRLYFSGNCVAA